MKLKQDATPWHLVQSPYFLVDSIARLKLPLPRLIIYCVQ